jgi:MFS family permease
VAGLGQFFWLYCFDVLGTTTLQASLLNILLPAFVSFLCTTFYGPLIDKLGRKPLIIIGGMLIVPGALGWFFMSRGHWLPGFLLVLVANLGWPAVETGRFNILLGMSETRAGRGSGIAYVAINSLVIAISGALSGLCGAALARSLGPHWHATLLGMPLTYHRVMFLASTALRAAALLWLIGFVEPRAFATRAAMRYVATAMIVELQTVVITPYRLLRRIGGAAFKINRTQKLKR